jgi:hypothetical protein
MRINFRCRGLSITRHIDEDRKRPISILGFACALFSLAAAAHHAPSEFDFKKIVEIEGTLAEVRWQNPHIRILVRTGIDASGKPIVVDVEGGALSIMRRTNATPEGLHVGDTVRVAGFPSRRSATRMWGQNLLQANGKEMLFEPGLFPRWAKAPLGSESKWFDKRDVEKSSAGIFRVWSSHLHEFFLAREKPVPLNEAANKKLAAWDPLTDSVSHGCEPVGMPTIMDQPYPLEFVKQQDTILLRMELYDAVRTIHMREDVALSELPKHLFGRSIGRWEGDTLVVKTDGILWSYLEHNGTPLGAATSIVERFTPAPDGTRLQYDMIVTDDEYLTEPLVQKKTFFARPDETVKPYECKKS